MISTRVGLPRLPFLFSFPAFFSLLLLFYIASRRTPQPHHPRARSSSVGSTNGPGSMTPNANDRPPSTSHGSRDIGVASLALTPHRALSCRIACSRSGVLPAERSFDPVPLAGLALPAPKSDTYRRQQQQQQRRLLSPSSSCSQMYQRY